MVIQTYAIDSSDYGLKFGKRGIDIPSLLLLTGIVIATIGYFLMLMLEDEMRWKPLSV